MNKVVINNDFISNLKSFTLENDNNYVINWNELEVEVIEFVIPSNSFVQVLENGNKLSRKIKYILKEGSKLKLTICSLDNASDNNYEFSLEAFCHVEAAYADFDKGNKKCLFNFSLNGENASVNWHLASLTSGTDKKEFDVSFTHNVSHTTAMMNNYGVCENNSTLIFSGIGHIKKDSKGAKTHQNAKIMVFDKNCTAKALPILKIDENDVEASHAACVGKVSDEHLFYLMSRGLSNEEAKRIITLGYLNPIIKYFDDENISSAIANAIERRI